MRKEAYNYKQAFHHPIVIRKLTDRLTLPFGGVRLARAVIFMAVLAILWLFRDIVFSLGSLMPGLSLVLFLGIPFLISGWLLKINPDGKKLHYFLWDYLTYQWTVKQGKKRISNDSLIRYMDKKVSFEPFYYGAHKKRKGENER